MESALHDHTQSSRLPAEDLSPSIPTAFSERRNWFYRIAHWETWDWRIKYILIAPVWFWFCLRARSLWFFTAANPTLTFGGFEGESKKEMYDQLPAGSYPKTFFISPHLEFSEVKEVAKRLSFPLAVKPDVGKMGFMFRRIESMEQLKSYHETLQRTYLIQEFIEYPLEVSVFYYRMPGQKKGTITGFVRKEFLEITGDGHSTLSQLIYRYPRVQFRLEEMMSRHRTNLHRILAVGEKYCLCPALNLSRGGKLVSLEHEIDEALVNVFDRLSHHNGPFYYGRYDIKCHSIESLKAGRNFVILEYNGSGAEPHHVYGNGLTLFEACGILISHWHKLFQIARANNKSGVRYWDFKGGWRFLKQAARNIALLRKLDSQTE